MFLDAVFLLGLVAEAKANEELRQKYEDWFASLSLEEKQIELMKRQTIALEKIARKETKINIHTSIF